MTRYSSLLGRCVEVVYRLGTVNLLAVGVLLADSGEFIFVRHYFDQHGSTKAFQLKIPFDRVVQLKEKWCRPGI